MYGRICVAGGDVRARLLAGLLTAEGSAVDTLGLVPGDERTARLDEADALILPYPFSVREGKLPTLSGLTLYARDALAEAKPGARLLAGMGLDEMLRGERFRDKAFVVRRYQDDEAFLRRNADLSAEAAVYEAMARTDRTLCGMTALVTGYGLFGRALALKLHALGAVVWVGARREERRLLAASDGMRALALEDLAHIAPLAEIALNTIPSRDAFTAATLAALPVSTPFLELASAPYGVSPAEAARRAPHYEILPALPARYAPQSAAEAQLDAARRLLLEESA